MQDMCIELVRLHAKACLLTSRPTPNLPKVDPHCFTVLPEDLCRLQLQSMLSLKTALAFVTLFRQDAALPELRTLLRPWHLVEQLMFHMSVHAFCTVVPCCSTIVWQSVRTHLCRLKQGKRIPHTLGDAPTFKFGVRLKGTFDSSWPSNMSPGPDYHIPGTLGANGSPQLERAPRFSFGPSTLRQQARRQTKQQAIKVCCSSQ